MANTIVDLPPFQFLVLSRLLIGGEKGVNRATIQKDLSPLAGQHWSAGELSARLETALEELASTGFLDRIERGVGKKKAHHFALNDTGRDRILKALGLDALPPKSTWSQMVSKYLSAVAVGLRAPSGAAAKAFTSPSGFKSVVLRHLHELPVPETATLTQATDSLLWKLLGRKSADKFELKAVKEFLILRALGEEHPRPKKIDVEPLILRDLRPRNSKAPELRAAAVRRWLDKSPAEPDPSSKPTTARPTPPLVASLPLDEFARRVVAAAQRSPGGRFGANKVFIAHVWRVLRDDSDFRGMDLDSFKGRLTEANQARHLDLSRADLVEAMDPDDVRDSETSHFGAQYHFIRF